MSVRDVIVLPTKADVTRSAADRIVDAAASAIAARDERCVPPDDPASNYRTARETLLDHVPARVHRMRGEDEPAAAAAAYENELRELFGDTPRFDIVLAPRDGGLVWLVDAAAAAKLAPRST